MGLVVTKEGINGGGVIIFHFNSLLPCVTGMSEFLYGDLSSTVVPNWTGTQELKGEEDFRTSIGTHSS